MSGGHNSRGGRSRGSAQYHQRGGWRGRGRGRGRGQAPDGITRGYHTLDEMDDVYLMAENTNYVAHDSNRGSVTPRGARGRPQPFHNTGSGRNTPTRGMETPRGRGRGAGSDWYPSGGRRGKGGIGDTSPRSRGKGRHAGGGSRLRPDAVPLSSLLYEERPLLRPVVFVRSMLTTTLFEEEDEIFRPVTEEIGEGEESHVPTAERVFRVFSGNVPRVSPPHLEEEDSDLEEVDFNDIGKLLDLPDYKGTRDIEVVEERFAGFYIDATTSSQGASSSSYHDAPMKLDGPAPVASIPSLWDGGTGDADLASERVGSQVTAKQEALAPDVDSEHHLPNVQPTISTNDNIQSPLVATALPERGRSSPPSPSPPTHGSEVDGKDLGPSSLFYIDTEPSPVPFDVVAPSTPPRTTLTSGRSSAEEEVIVYVAPHPRPRMEFGKETPGPWPGTDDGSSMAAALSMTSVLTGTTSTRSSVLPSPPPFASVSFTSLGTGTPSLGKSRQVNHPLVDVVLGNVSNKVRMRKRVHEARTKRKRREREEKMERMFSDGGGFGASALKMAEARLRGDEVVGFGGKDDPRWEQRRRGDSDVDWGSDEEGEGEGRDGVAEGMEVDPELVDEVNGDAMRRFVEGMSGGDAGRWESMGDLEDKERLRVEDGDDEGEQRGSSGEDLEGGDDNEDEDDEDDEEIERIVDREEKLLIAEGMEFDGLGEDDEDENEDNDSDDPEVSPGTSFKVRLAKLRSQAKRITVQDEGRNVTLTDEEDDAFMENRRWTKHDEDEAYLAHMQDILDENNTLLKGRTGKARNQLFRAVLDGDFSDLDDEFNFKKARKRKDKAKDLPEALQAQWEQDRLKKAEYKRERAGERLRLAADPLSPKKGGKKGRKAMLRAAKLDATITVVPNRVIDMTTLVQQIRRFLADLKGPRSMTLPPTNKETRKIVHHMALAFGMKSESKGKGEARYTTLFKTTRSGVGVDERKIAEVVRWAERGGRSFGGNRDNDDAKGKGRGGVPKHKEGDEVGKAAPKIGEGNIGFRMLSQMGWSEGDRIGVSSEGLDAPITAVIKHSKRGLGATK